MMFRIFLADLMRVFYAPRALYRDMAQGRHTPSWLCVLLYCLVYEFGVLWLYFNGFKPFMPTWIRVPDKIYYLIESFYILPVIFLMWILGTGVLHVLSGVLFRGRGRFESLFVMTGYSLWAPWYPLIVADSIHAAPEWLYNSVLSLCILLLLAETTLAAREEEKIGWGAAFVSSFIAITSIGAIMYTYIR